MKPSQPTQNPPPETTRHLKLAVVIPVRNDWANLRRCLACLSASCLTADEVLVIDDASTDETPERAAKAGATVLRLATRSGPAAARNRGASAASSPYLLFLDADVCVHPETIGRIVQRLQSDPTIDALFGSYDQQPAAPGLISQYKNLFHHFVHQQAREEASTFWSGCGAIKRDVFLAVGGFDTRFGRPCIEDVELGLRLRKAGRRIVLDKSVQVTHLKRWTLVSLVRTDVWQRGVPWARLIMRERNLPNDLNLHVTQRLSAVLAVALLPLLGVAVWRNPALTLWPLTICLGLLAADGWTTRHQHRAAPLAAAAAPLWVGLGAGLGMGRWDALVAALLIAGILALNWPFYCFFARARQPWFASAVVPLHLLYFWYSTAAMAIGAGLALWRAGMGASPRGPFDEPIASTALPVQIKNMTTAMPEEPAG